MNIDSQCPVYTRLCADSRQQGGALDPVATFRASRYRAQVARARSRTDYVPPQSL